MSVPVLSSSSQLSIRGVHASNIQNTPIITSYPSSTTSNSVGHYNFVDETTKASNHLNCSSNLAGGHIFSHVSSTDAPATILKVDRTALTLDSLIRNSTGKTVLDLTENKLSLKNVDGSETGNISILSSTDLTFNSVSLPSTVSTNTQNIATNTIDIQNLQNKDLQVVVSQITLSSPVIYADSSLAPQPSQFLASYGYNGWGYKKQSPQSSNAKINYYFPFPKYNGTVGDLKGLYYQIFNNCSSSDDLPFFTVYTRPTGVNDYRSWYHSSNTYVATTNSPANQSCQMFMNIKNLNFTPYSVNVQNQISLSQSTVTNPRGDYLDTDVILFISFGTNSASALNAVDFVVSKIGIITDFSTEFLLL